MPEGGNARNDTAARHPPAAAAPVPAEPPPAVGPHAAGSGPDPPLGVLVIAPDAGRAHGVREGLVTHVPAPVSVEVAQRLSDAIKRLRQWPFDAVLLDTRLPDSDPHGAVEAIQGASEAAIVLLAAGPEEEAAVADAPGSVLLDHLVADPARPADLARTVRYAIARRRLEIAYQHRSAELEQAIRLKDLYADIIRHDLLDVLSIAKGAVDLVLDDPADGRERTTMLAIAQRNLERLHEILAAASLYARVEQPGAVPPQPVDLTGLLAAAVERVRPAAERKGMTVKVEAPAAAPMLGNQWLEDVFANLLSNAVKYSPDGSTVEVEIADAGTHYRIAVRDRGEGIADADKPGLFTRFRRFHKQGVKGTGLGLAIVQRIVDLHRGRVWVEDNPGGGSVFRVDLPRT